MKKILTIILATVFIDMLGFGILIPVMPQFFANPNSSFYLLTGSSLSTGYLMLGILLAVFPLGQFIATPILGQLSDRFGRKPILAISILGTSIGYMLFALGIYIRSIPLIVFSRFFDGLTGGNISVAQAALADITKPEDRSKTFGMMGAVFGIGFIIGPYLGGILSTPTVVSWFNPTTPFWFAAILALCNMISILFFFPETHTTLLKEKSINLFKSVSNILKAYTMPKLGILFKTNFLYQSGFTFFTSFFNVFLIAKFAITEAQIGMFFAYLGIWIAFNQGFITRIASKHVSEKTILSWSLISTGSMLLLYFVPNTFHGIFYITPLFAIPSSLSMANLNGFISRSAPKEVQGEILGMSASVQALAQTIPAFISGFAASIFSPGTPILVGSLFMILGGFYFISKKHLFS